MQRAHFQHCDEMAGDRPRPLAYEIFSIKRSFQQFKSRPPRFQETGAGGRQRRLPFPKTVILPLLARVAWKRLQIGTDMLLIITTNSHKLFIGANVNDLKWPWTFKIGVLVSFLAISGCVRRFKNELHRNGWRWSWQPAYDIFTIERTFLRI